MSEGFIPLAGEAPGQAGLLVGFNRSAVAFVFGAFDKRIQQNVLRLHMCSGATIQIENPDVIEDVLSRLEELEGARWQLRLEDLESRDIG